MSPDVDPFIFVHTIPVVFLGILALLAPYVARRARRLEAALEEMNRGVGQQGRFFAVVFRRAGARGTTGGLLFASPEKVRIADWRSTAASEKPRIDFELETRGLTLNWVGSRVAAPPWRSDRRLWIGLTSGEVRLEVTPDPELVAHGLTNARRFLRPSSDPSCCRQTLHSS
jgi:hypothetical protein